MLSRLDKIRKVKGGSQFRRVDRLHQSEALAAFFAVNVALVLVHEGDGSIANVIAFDVESADHFIAKIENVPAIRRVIAEDADQGGRKKLGGVDGDFEPLEMLGPRIGDLHFADRGSDAGHAETGCIEFGLDLPAERFVKIEDILPIHAAKFEVTDMICPAEFDLVIQLRRNLIGEGGQLQHIYSFTIDSHSRGLVSLRQSAD